MKAAIHYVVRVKVIVHNKDTNEIDFEEFERKFENENPILAREDAFDDYEHNIKNFRNYSAAKLAIKESA